MSPQPTPSPFVVPFSHLDLFWTGTREECLSRGNTIISRALDLLEVHEDFRFLIETANFLEHYVSCYPQEKTRILKFAEEGRLELTPIWSAIYLNLPGGETLARNVMLGQSYVRGHFKRSGRTAHFGDLPGYTPQYPQIAKLSGLEFVLMSRGGPADTPLFQWEGLNGQTVLSYFVPWGYALFAMHTDWHLDYEAMTSGKLKDLLDREVAKRPAPSLIHWGCDLYAPNANLVDNVTRWNQEGQEPQLQFATLDEFFTEAEQVEDLLVLKGELPSFWPNIESTWPHIWPEDMPCEAALHMAEFLSTTCLLNGWNEYPQAEFEDAWKALLDAMDHNQNNQGGDRADRDKLQLKRYSRYLAERIRDKMAWRLASQIPVPDEQHFPVMVFNSLSWRRTGLVTGRAGVFGDARSCDINAFDEGFRLIDADGETIPYVALEQYDGLSSMFEIAFHAHDLPAAGYQTYYLVPGSNPIEKSQTCQISLDVEIDQDPGQTVRYSPQRVVPTGPRRNMGHNRYENKFFRVDVDVVTGSVLVYDRIADEPLFNGLHITGVEERRGNYIYDMTPSGREFPFLLESVETVDNNALWCRIRIRGSVYGMPTVQTLTMFEDQPEIHITNEIDWRESRWVRLQQVFDYAGEGDTLRYGVPYGWVTYPEMLAGAAKGQGDEISDADSKRLRLCRHWVDIGNDSAGVTIAADHRMWEFGDEDLRSYMVRGTGHCGGVRRRLNGPLESASYPPADRYIFRYVIRPRRESLAKSAAYRCGWELNHPPLQTAVCGSKNTGRLPVEGGLFDFTDSSVVATAIKKSEEGDGIVLRAFEATGQGSSVSLPDFPGRQGFETNFLEETRQPLSAIRPFEIKSWIFEPQES
ncbi:glycosyl hydrolase-related protein [Kiritimatiellota bacterium B12222]|nr:glycosyl hydrolase-related protein [Kiritimatiellota bacterium B12222]